MIKSHKDKKDSRLSMHMEPNQHRYIKSLAEKEGISMRDFVCKTLPYPGKQDSKDLDPKEFNNLLYEITKNFSKHLRNLSDE